MSKPTSVKPPLWSAPDRYMELMDSPWGKVLVTVQDAVSFATAQFWAAQGVPTLHLPVTTGAVSSPLGLGSDSQPVRVDMFGQPTYLADSMQFSLEYGCRLSDSGCYYLMPSFRGEDPDASHLCQFFHSEAELPGGLDTTMSVVEDYLRHLTRHLLITCADTIRDIAGTVTHLEGIADHDGPFERITFSEAVHLLAGDPELIRTGTAPGSAPWRTVTRAAEQKLLTLCGSPVWVTNYDHLAVPFYQAYADDSRRTALNADLLLGVGEVVGAGERHTTAAEVRDALELHHISEKPYEWYVEMREHRPLHTSGFGMGVERLLMWALDHDDIRDLQILVRRNGENCTP
ncbi:amino acid--tRNA ligase-related protein [Streptomyces sp. NPDC093109]|uniref:amino acid--tRNA ligase-related protein n=1 Tax=Streptomyces sp. NPDC093109 TaxID=3154977 RepID=UPI00344F0AD3